MVPGKQMVILEKEGTDGSGEEAAWGEEQSQLGHSRRGETEMQLPALGECCDSSGPQGVPGGRMLEAMWFSMMGFGGER